VGGEREVPALAQVPPEAFAGATGEQTLKVSADWQMKRRKSKEAEEMRWPWWQQEERYRGG